MKKTYCVLNHTLLENQIAELEGRFIKKRCFGEPAIKRLVDDNGILFAVSWDMLDIAFDDDYTCRHMTKKKGIYAYMTTLSEINKYYGIDTDEMDLSGLKGNDEVVIIEQKYFNWAFKAALVDTETTKHGKYIQYLEYYLQEGWPKLGNA